jgi:hypothetical protein
MVLCPVAGIAAALSFESLYQAARPTFGRLALGFPLLLDTLVAGSMLAFLAGATVGRPRAGWRWTAHGGVTGTLVLNAMAASSLSAIPWHVTPGLVWSILVEMTARQVIGDWQARHDAAAEPISGRLWLISPVETARTWRYMARTGQPSHRQARADLAVLTAAVQVLRMAMPARRQRAARHLICRQLWAGAIDPATLLAYLHDQDSSTVAGQPTAMVIQAFLTQEHGQPETGALSRPREDADKTPTRSTPAVIGRPAQPRQNSSAGPPTSSTGTLGTKHAAAVGRNPGRRHRDEAAVEIQRAHPGLDGHGLARELAARGWNVSARTARRILAETNRE